MANSADKPGKPTMDDEVQGVLESKLLTLGRQLETDLGFVEACQSHLANIVGTISPDILEIWRNDFKLREYSRLNLWLTVYNSMINEKASKIPRIPLTISQLEEFRGENLIVWHKLSHRIEHLRNLCIFVDGLLGEKFDAWAPTAGITWSRTKVGHPHKNAVLFKVSSTG